MSANALEFSRVVGCKLSIKAVLLTDDNLVDVIDWVASVDKSGGYITMLCGVKRLVIVNPCLKGVYCVGTWLVLIDGEHWANWTQVEYDMKVGGPICTCDVCMAARG